MKPLGALRTVFWLAAFPFAVMAFTALWIGEWMFCGRRSGN